MFFHQTVTVSVNVNGMMLMLLYFSNVVNPVNLMISLTDITQKTLSIVPIISSILYQFPYFTLICLVNVPSFASPTATINIFSYVRFIVSPRKMHTVMFNIICTTSLESYAHTMHAIQLESKIYNCAVSSYYYGDNK